MAKRDFFCGFIFFRGAIFWISAQFEPAQAHAAIPGTDCLHRDAGGNRAVAAPWERLEDRMREPELLQRGAAAAAIMPATTPSVVPARDRARSLERCGSVYHPLP